MGRAKEPLASVVIPARDSAATIAEQLAALARQEFDGAWEVVVADNGSTDATAALVRDFTASFPVPLRIIDAGHRRGANVARNLGVRASTAPRLLFCDSDDRVTSTWVRGLVEALDVADTAGGPLDYDALNPPEVRARGLDVASSIQEHRGFRYALSANLGVRREVFTRVGPFDESFRHGFDEVDFGYRVHRAGLTLADAPAAIVHYRLRSTRRALLRQHFHYGLGSRMFCAKHPELHDPQVDALPVRLRTVVRKSLRLGLAVFDEEPERDRVVRTFGYALGDLGLTRPARRVRTPGGGAAGRGGTGAHR